MAEPPSGRSAPRTLTRLIQQAELAIYALDQFGRIRSANAALAQLVGLSLEELTGLDCSDPFPSDGSRSSQIAAWLGWCIGRSSGGPFELSPLPTPAAQVEADHRWPVGSDTAPRGWRGYCWTLEAERHRFWLCAVHAVGRADIADFGCAPPQAASLPGERRPPADPRQVLIAIRSRYGSLDSLGPLVGVSAGIQRAMAQAQAALASQPPIPIWLHGPAGSGKQEIARGLVAGRSASKRGQAGDPELVVIHCPLMDDSLMESVLELYRDRAAAQRRMPALILQQLDQLNEQPQARLLGFLDHYMPDPLITTSRQPPSKLTGRDGQRLLAKLAIMTVDLPPLGERPEDLPSLCARCLGGVSVSGSAKLSPLGLSTACEQLIGVYPWPGNYRELEQALTAAAAAATADSAVVIEPRHLPLALRTAGSLASGLGDPTWLKPIKLDEVLLEVERVLIERALAAEPRNRAATARLLGLSRTRLLRRIEQLGLSAPDAEPSPAD